MKVGSVLKLILSLYSSSGNGLQGDTGTPIKDERKIHSESSPERAEIKFPTLEKVSTERIEPGRHDNGKKPNVAEINNSERKQLGIY